MTAEVSVVLKLANSSSIVLKLLLQTTSCSFDGFYLPEKNIFFCSWVFLSQKIEVFFIAFDKDFCITVQPAYTERFGATKTVPYVQKNRISEIHIYIYIYIYMPARENTTT